MSVKKVETIEYEPEMSFSEIARELGISRTAVLETYSRAMRKLMKLLEVKENAN